MITKEKVTHFLSNECHNYFACDAFTCECNNSTIKSRIREKSYAFVVDANPDHSLDVLVILKSTGDVYYPYGLAKIAGTEEKFYNLLGDQKPLAKIQDRE